MTTVSADPAPVSAAGPITTAGILRSELTKFRSLRSSWWTLAVAVAATLGLSALVGADSTLGTPGNPTTAGHLGTQALFGVVFAQLATSVLGVLMISGEYGTGMIRTSLTVVPTRLPVLCAKAVVYTAVVLPVSAIAAVLSFWSSQAIRSARGISTATLGDDGVLRTVVGSALYVAVAGLFALGVATVLRHTAAGLASVVGLFFVLPVVTSYLPAGLSRFGEYLPSNAGGALYGLTISEHSLSPWPGFALLVSYTVVALTVAAVRLRRSDV